MAAGIWTVYGAGSPIRVHMVELLAAEDVYEDDAKVTIQITRTDTGRSVSATLILGFLNETLDRYDESCNLRPRADLRYATARATYNVRL